MELPASGFAPFLIAPDAALHPIAQDGGGMTVHATERRSGTPVYLRYFPASELADERSQQDFVRLARTLIEADHPCFTRIIDTGCEGNLFYYAMQAAPGALLEKWMSVRPLSAEAVVLVLKRCLEGLAKAQIYPGLIPRLWTGNIHLTTGPEQSGCEVRLLLHHLVPARPPLDEPSALPPECSGVEPDGAPGTIFSVGILLKRLLSVVPHPVPPSLLQAAEHLSAPDPFARPASFEETLRILEAALSGSIQPDAPSLQPRPLPQSAPDSAAPESPSRAAIGRLTLELTRRAQAELHLASRINALEARLRDSESAKRRLEEEIAALRHSAMAEPKPVLASRDARPDPHLVAPASDRSGRSQTPTLDRRESPEFAAPWILWCALAALAVLMLAALYLLFQTLSDAPPRRQRPPAPNAGLSAPLGPPASSALPIGAARSGLRLIHLETLELIRRKDWLGIQAILQNLQDAPTGAIGVAEIRGLAATLAADLESSLRHVPTIASEEGFRQLRDYLAAVQQESQPDLVP